MTSTESPPFSELPAIGSVTWSIPGLREDPTMCLRCRSAQLLCGKPVCPILVKYQAFAKTMPLLGGRDLDGSVPPGVFVGRFGYPKVSLGPLLSPLHGDTLLYDTPEEWVGRSVGEVVGFRTSLVRGTHRVHVLDAEKGLPIVDRVQEIALSAESIEVEARFKRAPRGHLTLSDELPPYGPTAPIESVRLNVRRVDPHLERLTRDTDANARVAVNELYGRGVRVSRIQRAFSAGTLGRHGRRRFVPTRWSITAVDDLVGKQNLDRVRSLPELSEILLYRFTALDNRWIVALLPGAYRYESIEAWYPNTLWNPNTTSIIMLGDHEGHFGRTTYASMGGCYYAARLATSEELLRRQRQAGVLVLREVHPGEILPLGVWNVREHLRAAFQQRPEPVVDLDDLTRRIAANFAIPLDRWMRQSALLHEARTQRRLDEWMAPVPLVGALTH
ncbi:MAG: Nre family DNA repair protein [Thermoplasmata archaeon]|nr:Nre family DNA repair protein [Thermoplasmata archaeon]